MGKQKSENFKIRMIWLTQPQDVATVATGPTTPTFAVFLYMLSDLLKAVFRAPA